MVSAARHKKTRAREKPPTTNPGLYNIVLGLWLDIPVPVQPMKTIAAIGATGTVSLPAVLAAGLFVGACIVTLGLTRAVDFANAIIPRSIVRGLQLGVGLKLAASGVAKALLVPKAKRKLTLKPGTGADSWPVGAATLLFLVAASTARPRDDPADAAVADAAVPLLPTRMLAWRRRSEEVSGTSVASASSASADPPESTAAEASSVPTDTTSCCSPPSRRPPAALLVAVIGVIVAIARAPASARSALRLGPSPITASVPSKQDWILGITKAGGAAQLPLTTLNSVVAVTALADTLYPNRANANRWRPGHIAMAVGLMNLVGCWFGAMPSCSGSGGLAAQHKFGGRSGGAPVLLGLFKLVISLLFGSSLSSILTHFPDAMLGGLLACAGAELAASARHEAGPRGFTFCALTAAAILATDDAGAGFLIAYACWVATVAWEAVEGRVVKWVGAWRRRRRVI